MRYLFVLLAAVHVSAFGASPTPRAAAEAFYRWVIAYDSPGLPSARQRQQLTRLLTPDLVGLLAAASVAERRCVANLPPDMKGDIWEGNPFVSNYEGASAARYGASRVKGRDVIVEVDLLDVDRQRPKGDPNRNYSWRDSVLLKKESEGWLVADVYRRGSLRGMLRDYIDHGCGRG